jgi:non-ribosomal peptide synthase protein (TIGR01720 family)
VEALESWAAGPEGEAEAADWRGREGVVAEAAGAGGDRSGPWLERDAERLEAALPAGPTRDLLARASGALRARPDEVLLAGVAAALASEGRGREGRGRAVRLAVEGHGRGLPGEGSVDLSRTVGWFTVVYPVRIEVPPGGAARALRAVKAALRAVPSGGVGYAALRWGAGRALGDSPAPEVSFNYLGRLDETLGEGAPFRLAPEAPGPLRDPGAPRAHPLEVNAYLLDGELRTVWSYDRLRYRRGEVEALAEATLAVVRELAAGEGAGGEDGSALDPTDFPHAGLDDRSLERLVGKLGGG